jgi:hypothetical protein
MAFIFLMVRSRALDRGLRRETVAVLAGLPGNQKDRVVRLAPFVPVEHGSAPTSRPLDNDLLPEKANVGRCRHQNRE